jgi:hypothetical protein
VNASATACGIGAAGVPATRLSSTSAPAIGSFVPSRTTTPSIDAVAGACVADAGSCCRDKAMAMNTRINVIVSTFTDVGALSSGNDPRHYYC